MICFLCKQGKTVLLVSLEMPHLEINGKIISYLTGISSEIIRKQGKQEDKILKEIISALATINTYNLARMKVGAIAVADIEDEIKNLGGVDVVFIDYLQRIEPIFHKSTRYEQITQISNDLKTLALKLNIPVVAVASINRAFTVRADKIPRLSDFRGSGDIEYDVDVALLLYRKSQFEEQTGGSDPVSVIIGKNRYGKAGLNVDMVFKPEKNRYYEIEQESKKIKERKDNEQVNKTR
ncbi:Replicative DNA helicase [subsurface metagenome]